MAAEASLAAESGAPAVRDADEFDLLLPLRSAGTLEK